MANSNPVATATIGATAYSLTNTNAWGFSTTNVAAMNAIRVSSDGANLRFLTNGDTPTATTGHFMTDGQSYQFERYGRDNPEDIIIIAESGSATVTIELIQD